MRQDAQAELKRKFREPIANASLAAQVTAATSDCQNGMSSSKSSSFSSVRLHQLSRRPGRLAGLARRAAALVVVIRRVRSRHHRHGPNICMRSPRILVIVFFDAFLVGPPCHTGCGLQCRPARPFQVFAANFGGAADEFNAVPVGAFLLPPLLSFHCSVVAIENVATASPLGR